MATYEVTGPNGEVYHIDGPDDADPSTVITQLTGARHRFGSGAAGMKDFVNGKAVPSASPEALAARDPSAGGSTLQPFGLDTGIPLSQGVNRFLAGAGKATYDIGRGAGQMVGAESRADVQASRDRDAPLMATGAGKAGFLTGTVADMLPAALIPGAGTLGGAAAIGAGTGLMSPSTSTGETAENTVLGGLMGPAALGVGRGVAAVYRGVKGALEPLFKGGQERVAARTLQAFAGTPQEAASAAQNITRNGANVMPGIQPTTAELADNAGLAQFERSLRNSPEHLTALTERNQANRNVMTGALDSLAGTPQQMTQATAARAAQADPLYKAAGAVQKIPADEELNALLKRPSMSKAMQRAQELASERGETLVEGQDIPEVDFGAGLGKRNRLTPDASEDSVLQFLAKHPKGISSEEAAAQGLDPADMADATVGIKRAFRKGGMSFDQAAEMLHQHGYPVADEVGNYSPNKLLDVLDDELRGNPRHSTNNTRMFDEADFDNRPPPDLTELTQKATQANPKAAQAILDTWGDDSPETIKRVVKGLQGVVGDNPTFSGKAIQYLKMALNDMLDTAQQRGIGAHEQSALDSTLGAFNKWAGKNVPKLAEADTAYAQASKPINQMQVGGALRDKLVPALGDFGNNTRLSAANYANALRNGDRTAAQATGQPQLGLADVLSKSQHATVRQIGEQLARRANADELGKAVGSNTGQNLVSQNVLRQFLGPLGLPQGMGERAAQSTLGQTVLRPLQWVGKAAEPRVLDTLARAALNPQEAQRLLQLAAKNPKLARALWERQGLLGPIAQTAGQGLLSDAPQ